MAKLIWARQKIILKCCYHLLFLRITEWRSNMMNWFYHLHFLKITEWRSYMMNWFFMIIIIKYMCNFSITFEEQRIMILLFSQNVKVNDCWEKNSPWKLCMNLEYCYYCWLQRFYEWDTLLNSSNLCAFLIAFFLNGLYPLIIPGI